MQSQRLYFSFWDVIQLIFLNRLIIQRDWLFLCQVGTATATKLNSGVMDVSDEAPWNHGKMSSISHCLFAGKRLDSGV